MHCRRNRGSHSVRVWYMPDLMAMARLTVCVNLKIVRKFEILTSDSAFYLFLFHAVVVARRVK